MKARDGFTPIPHEHIPVPIYQSFAQTKDVFDGQGLEYKVSPVEDPTHRFFQRWIKGQFDGHTVHYEFADSEPRMITLHWTP